jgi:LCP family protein required for cell wall assembly
VGSPAEEDVPPRLAWGLYKRFAAGGLLIALMATVASATAVLLEVDKAANIFEEFSAPIEGLDGPGEAKDVLADVAAGKPQTILVLGSDRRFVDIASKAPTRSDTIILIRLDPSKGATAIMSIPRDLKVEIPGHGTDKINAAYSIDGPVLTVKTVRRLLGGAGAAATGGDVSSFPIHHVVNINFGGFQRAVNRLGCVYADIDRRYFNDNNPPNGGGPDYAAIDVPAGYQRMCGQDALDYVRYRHFDNDLVRAARQQDFLRQAKDQIGVSKLFGDRDELLKIFARYTQTDIRGTSAILRLLKLTFESSKNPIQEVRFPAEASGDYLVVGAEALARTVDRFMNAKGSPGSRGEAKRSKADRKRARRQRRRRSRAVPKGLFDARRVAEDQAIALGARLPFPVYYPRFAAIGSQYRVKDQRAYDIFDRGRHRYRAYRLVVGAQGTGQNYGIQGTTWQAPPILDNPSEKRRINGRTYELFFDGDRLRIVSWRTERAVYWVHNTLLQSLTNTQMLGIAGSLTRVGAK